METPSEQCSSSQRCSCIAAESRAKLNSHFCCFKIRRRLKMTTSPLVKMKYCTSKLRANISMLTLLLIGFASCMSLVNLAIGDAAISDASASADPVKITIQPNDLIAIEGESAELNCDAEGEPEPTIEWYHNGQLIKSSTNTRTTMGGSIQFLDIRPGGVPGSGQNFQQQQSSDAGVYHCVAKNQFGQARSRNATLQVAYIKEPFRVAPKDKLVRVGQDASFECLPQAWPEPRIQWRRNGRLIDPVEILDSRLPDGSAKYTINRIAMTEGLNSNSLQIASLGNAGDGGSGGSGAPNGAETLMTPANGGIGDFRVSGEGGGGGGQSNNNGDQQRAIQLIDIFGSQLVIRRADKADEGRYSCLVETKGSHRLIERESPSAQLTVEIPMVSRPKFTQQPADQSAEIGSRVQLKCSGEASPTPMLYWYKEGHRQLMFPSANPSSSQNNRSPQQQLWPQTAALTSMPTTLSDTSPAINRLFSMPIGLDHTPHASHNNYFGNRIYVDNQGTLNIVNVTASDNGYYACAIVSSVGSVLAKAKLTVKPSPNSPYSALNDLYASLQDPLHARMGAGLTSISGKYDLLPPPVIKMGSSNQTLPTNTSITLYCDVVSQVAYKIQWFFESRPLQEDPPRITVLDDGNLLINNLRISDTGIYSCVVTAATDQNMPISNPFESLEPSMLTVAPPVQQSTTHSCLIKVETPLNPNIQFYRMHLDAFPTPPGPPSLVGTNGDEAITITWAPPADSGALPVKNYVVEHYDTSQEHMGWRVIHRPNGKESLLIDGLSSEGSHFFVVRASNGHGSGPSSAIAGPFRTIAGQARYELEQQRRRNPTGLDFADTRQDTNFARERLMSVSTSLLSLNPVGPSSIKLQWSIQSVGNSSYSPFNSLAIGEYLEGYSIRYRDVGVGESLLGKDLLFGVNTVGHFDPKMVTSFVEEEETIAIAPRNKRDLASYYDFSAEFNEVRITDHNVEHYTINGLKPFTTYQFFVVPYYKDIDGVPSNILTAQTNEDRPSIAPAVLSVRPLNTTAIRLIWPHIPLRYANGIIQGYIIRVNQSDIATPRIMRIPMTGLVVAPTATLDPESKILSPPSSGTQQYVVMYDVTNLTYKSFCSIQVAGATRIGHGPWSEPSNFVMDPKKIADAIKANGGNALDDIMSQSFLATIPNSLDNHSSNSQDYTSPFVLVPVIFIILTVLLVGGFVLYRRNNQQVITWKKTISEHFTNKFYLPSSVDHDHHRGGPGSLQQNIYDHQHHLIYSAGSTHMVAPPQPTVPSQTMWAGVVANGPGGCITSSGTGSLSSHGGLLPISNDPNSMRIRGNNDQVLIMNTNNNGKDINSRYIRTINNGGMYCQMNADGSLPMGQQQQPTQQIIHHGGDYYSVMNNVAEYEELDHHQQQQQQQQQQHRHGGGNMQMGTNSNVAAERHQTGSSNSDTSCPSSVTRLLPNQNYNRGALEQQRHEMILQQQVGCNGDTKQPIITMINANDTGKFQQTKAALSPYATTNLMNQLGGGHQPQTHIFANPQMNLMNQQQQRFHHQQQQQQQQQNYLMHDGNSTMDDTSKILMAQQMNSGQGPNAATSFRTLQRHPNNLQPAVVHSQPTQMQQVFMQNDLTHFGANNHQSNYVSSQPSFQAHNNLVTNVASNNPLVDTKSNLYERIDYDGVPQQQMGGNQLKQMESNMRQNDMVSSSTSSGSVKSPQNHFRRNTEAELHDLRVFASADQADAERQRLNGTDGEQPSGELQCDDDNEDLAHVDETTAFRRPSFPGDEQRTRQLSKRKKKQQRSRLHNNNQPIG